MSRAISGLFVLAVTVASGTMVGCYTMLRNPHPDFSEAPANVDGSCASCHADADYYHYWIDPTYSYTLYPAPWTIYYDQVWWYPRYDHHPEAPDDDHLVTGGRHGWDRGPGPAPLPRLGGGIGGTSPPPRVTDLPPNPPPPAVETPASPGPRPNGPPAPPSTPEPKPDAKPDPRSSTDREREGGNSGGNGWRR